MVLDPGLHTNYDIITYHVERSESDLSKVGLKRLEASDNESRSVELHQGHGADHPSKQFQDPNITLSTDHDHLMHPPQKHLVLRPDDNSILYSGWVAGHGTHHQCTSYSTTSVVVAGTEIQRTWEVNPSSGLPMYSESSARALRTYVKPGPSPVAFSSQANRQGGPFQSLSICNSGPPTTCGAVMRQGSRKSCTECGKSFYAQKGLNRHMQDKHLPWKKCDYCDFSYSEGRKSLYTDHLHRDHGGAAPSRRLEVTSDDVVRVPRLI
ncbi:hypothetical protein BJV78DRAFT_367696 [Lactifluus subvellereus]|nr:hypothetical protein BJV78DRAFT_367696 [Lactifluus subvellereus]